MNNSQSNVGIIIGSIAVLIVVVSGILGLMYGLPAYNRYQILADEQNKVQVNDIQIAQTRQLVEVQKQKAQIKIEEAKGIAEAQRIINDTLTPLYLQHEAIQAQETQSNKIIYVPSGSQGIPLVNQLEK